MASLICVAFDDATTADKALTLLTTLQKEYLIRLTDACVVVRPAEGDIVLKQALPLTQLGATSGAASGALWGGLVGLMFLNPIAGLALGMGVGAATGAIAGKISDYGISDDFIRELGGTIKPDSSALFLLVEQVTADKVLSRMTGFAGHVLKTSLTDEQETKLRAALGDHGSLTAAKAAA